ncbi:MAG: thioredoxin [Candidatus Omnitrophota bacterium]
MSDNILHLKDGDFDKQVIEYKGVALVDFWAEWCMPCKMIAPAIEAAARDYAGKVRVAKVEIDEAGETASRFNVMNIPTLLFFKDGKEASRAVGVISKEEISRRLDALLK